MHAARLGLTLVLALAAPDTAVEVRTFRFRESAVEVPVGSEVRWINGDEIGHTVSAGTPERRDPLFDGTLDGAGATFAHRFDRAGTYPYFCARHPFMRGEVRVVTHTEGAP